MTAGVALSATCFHLHALSLLQVVTAPQQPQAQPAPVQQPEQPVEDAAGADGEDQQTQMHRAATAWRAVCSNNQAAVAAQTCTELPEAEVGEGMITLQQPSQ